MDGFTAGLIWTAGLIFFLLVLSAFLSGSETALTATSKARMLHLQQEGKRRARWVIVLLEQKERLLLSQGATVSALETAVDALKGQVLSGIKILFHRVQPLVSV